MVTSGGAAFAWDYEMPFMQAVTYYATDGTTKVTSVAINLNIRSCRITAPGLPAYDSSLRLSKVPRTVNRDRPGIVMRPLGRSTSVVLSDVMKARQFTVSAVTLSYAESTLLESVLETSSIIILQMPLTRWPWSYVAVSKLIESPTSEKLPDDPTLTGSTGAGWDFTCEVVGRPIGGVFGDPTAAYQVVRDTYPTYTAVRAAKASYLELLKGI